MGALHARHLCGLLLDAAISAYDYFIVLLTGHRPALLANLDHCGVGSQLNARLHNVVGSGGHGNALGKSS